MGRKGGQGKQGEGHFPLTLLSGANRIWIQGHDFEKRLQHATRRVGPCTNQHGQNMNRLVVVYALVLLNLDQVGAKAPGLLTRLDLHLEGPQKRVVERRLPLSQPCGESEPRLQADG